MIEGNYYYFDKTELISKIMEETEEVKLFTRSWRFGKTLNMSMIKFFLMLRIKIKIGNYLKI